MNPWRLLDEFALVAGAPSMQFLIEHSGRFGESHAEPIVDVNAVFSRCQKEVYKPKSLLMARGKAQEKDEQTECPVCLERFDANDEVFRLPCTHIFHAGCLAPWIKSHHDRCPFCRADILPKPNQIDNTAGPSNHVINPYPRIIIRNVPTTTTIISIPFYNNNNNNNNNRNGNPYDTRNVPINYGIHIRDVPISHGRPLGSLH